MKLYDCTPAPSPRRVRIFLAEKGMNVELVQVDLGSGEHLRAPFSTLNPLCEVPVLELEDGTVITEVGAICRYLEELQPEPALLGRTPVERAQVAMWDHRMEIDGFLAVAEVFRNHSKGFAGRALSGPVSFSQIPELAERGRVRVGLFFKMLEERLAQSPFVAGDNFSMADITALACIDFAAWSKLQIPDDFTHLKAWYKKIAARPSMAA